VHEPAAAASLTQMACAVGHPAYRRGNGRAKRGNFGLPGFPCASQIVRQRTIHPSHCCPAAQFPPAGADSDRGLEVVISSRGQFGDFVVSAGVCTATLRRRSRLREAVPVICQRGDGREPQAEGNELIANPLNKRTRSRLTASGRMPERNRRTSPRQGSHSSLEGYERADDLKSNIQVSTAPARTWCRGH
jgi:hypothetical protein